MAENGFHNHQAGGDNDRDEADKTIRKWRTVMGATDPAKAAAGSLRKEFGQSIDRNATHGSDAPETAAYEIGYFFAGVDLI